MARERGVEKKILLSLRIYKEKKDTLSALAAKKGMTLSELMIKSAEFYGSMDNNFTDKLHNFSEGTGLADWLIAQNLVTVWMAHMAAREEVFGVAEGIMPEFQFDASGPIDSDQLFKCTFDNYVRQFEQMKKDTDYKVVADNTDKDNQEG